MNYYLTPPKIAEALNLTQLRKHSPGGMYLLSESDLVPYGIERAINEGAIELSNDRRQTPAQESVQQQASENPETPEEAETHGESETSEETETHEEPETSEETEAPGEPENTDEHEDLAVPAPEELEPEEGSAAASEVEENKQANEEEE